MYLYDAGRDIALPIFVSTEAKEDFDYEDVPWREMAEEIYQDLVDGNIQKFQEVRVFPK